MKTFLTGSLVILICTVAPAQDLRFEEVTAMAFPARPFARTQIREAVFDDFNNDGYADLLLAARGRPLLLWENRQDGTFALMETAFESNPEVAQLLPADFDNDGDVDFAALTTIGACRLFQNQGAGGFREITFSAGLINTIPYRDLTAADFDNNGRLDLLLLSANGKGRLFLQDTPAHFVSSSPLAYLPSSASSHVLACDWDNDRDQDLIITRGPGQSNLIYENGGRAQFSENANAWGIADYNFSAMGSAIADVNNDGRLDLLLLREHAPAAFCMNMGTRFQAMAGAFASWPSFEVSSAVFADFDNDGGPDLLLAGAGGLQIGRQNNDHSFAGVSTFFANISAITLTAVADFDRDGRLDIFAGSENGAMHLFKNISTPKHAWFSALLVGECSNRNGFGGGVSFWRNGRVVRQSLQAASGYHGSVANRWVHAGLNESARIDSIVIAWPSGEHGRFYQKLASRHMVFREGETEAVFNGQFADISNSAGIGGIPEHGGHAILFADVNGDRREDMYVTHTNFVPGSQTNFLVLPDELFINNGNNTFTETAASAGVNDPGQSHGAVFVDIDNDGDFDLFNGQRGPSGNRLYRNNGSGNFTEITAPAGILPADRRTIGVLGLDIENDGDMDLFSANWGEKNEMYVNNGTGSFAVQERGVSDIANDPAGTMAATAADVDNDGDLDIFIGKREDTCRLYINNGAGNFTDQAASRGVAFNGVGNGAVFFDMDRDADLDMLLAVSSNNGSRNGELTRLRVYRNDGSGDFNDETNAQNIAFEGYTVNTGDLDHDGDEDIYLSINFGMSSLWLNDGTGHFTKQNNTGLERNGVDARATTFGDIDNDGDLDIGITYIEEPTFLYRNDLNTPGGGARNFLQIAVVSPGNSAGGWGTKFYLYEAGHLDQQNFLRGYKQITSAQGTLSGNSPVAHFGVDQNKTYDLRVRYLNGSSRVLANLAPGQRIDLDSANDTTPPVISAVAATLLVPNGATVTWSTNEPATSQVEYGATTTLGTFTPLDNMLVQSHSVALNGLTAGATYFYRVISADAAGNSASSATASFVAASIDNTPPVITNVQATEIQSSSARIGWNTDEPATSQIEYGKTTSYGTTTTEDQALVTSHESVLAGLESNTTYHYRVRSRDAQGNLALSNDFQFTTLGGPLLADDFNGASLDLNKWTRGSHASNQSAVQGGALHLKTSTSNTSGWIHTANKFSAKSKTIQLKVIQPNNDGALGMSPTVTTSATNGFYDEPNWYRFYNYRSSNSGSYKLFVQWKRNGAGGGLDVAAGVNFTGNFYLRLRIDETKIYFEYSFNNTGWTTAHSETFSLPGYTLDSLFACELSAYNTPQKGEWVIDDFAINSTVPPPSDNTPPVISQVASGNITAAAATITWNTNEAGDSQVEYGLTTSYGSQSALNATPVTAHTVALSNLQANTTYHYRVKSKDAAGNLAVSGGFTFTTLADQQAPVISSVAASAITSASANINWNTNEPGDSQVEYGLTASYGAQSPLNTALATAHTVALSNLQASTTYHYRVKSKDAAGNLATGGDFIFITLAPGPIFSDNFNGSTLDLNKWVKGSNSGNQSRVANNRLELRSSGFHTGWVVTKQSYSARHATAAVKVVQPSNDGNLGISPSYTASSANGIYNEANWYRFYTYRDQSSGPYLLFVQWKKNGVEDGLDVTGSLNITGAVYLRLRMDETEIHFEASLDNTTWIDAYHEPFGLPGYTLDSQFYFELAAYRTSQKGVLIVDDFTITGGPSTVNLAKNFSPEQIQETLLPAALALGNYPNPFNLSTRVRFELPQAAAIEITAFDFTGRKVGELTRGNFAAGTHEIIWEGTNAEGLVLSSGTYFVRLRVRAENSNETAQLVRRVTLLK